MWPLFAGRTHQDDVCAPRAFCRGILGVPSGGQVPPRQDGLGYGRAALRSVPFGEAAGVCNLQVQLDVDQITRQPQAEQCHENTDEVHDKTGGLKCT